MTIEELLCEAYQKVHKDQAKLILATLLNQNPLELTMHLDLKVNEELINKYPIITIEDPVEENDFQGFALMTKRFGDRIQFVCTECWCG